LLHSRLEEERDQWSHAIPVLSGITTHHNSGTSD
jgi:hypothetical protein